MTPYQVECMKEEDERIAKEQINDMDDTEILNLGLDAGLESEVATYLREIHIESLIDTQMSKNVY